MQNTFMKLSSFLIAFSGVCFHTANAQETASRAEVTVGVKAWDASWSSYFPGGTAAFTPAGAPVRVQTTSVAEGKEKVEALPTLSVRYGRYFLSAGFARFNNSFYSPATVVPVSDAANFATSRTDTVTRREVDVNAGYFVLPALALTLGYKGGHEKRESSVGIQPGISNDLADIKVNAILLGALGAYELAPGVSAYEQFGYGFGREKTTVGNALGQETAGQVLRGNVRYLINEVGIAYRLPIASSWVKRSSVALGYRSQTIKTKAPLLNNNGDLKLRDVRDGLILAVNATF